MSALARGLYEVLVTQLLERQLRDLECPDSAELDDLRNAEAADRIAWHVAHVLERVIEDAPDDTRAADGVELARRLIDVIAERVNEQELAGLQLASPAKVLHAIREQQPDGTAAPMPRPLIPLLDTTLLTNAPGEPRGGHQIQAEIGAADRIDVVMAFIRRTGINPLIDVLRRHVERGKPLRVLTTVYTGTTEPQAIEALLNLGAQVRVSYDTSSTRLHAKAWLFLRDSGYSTAYVGSSNLTHSAQVTGLEWNVRVSGARNRAVIEKIGAVFESYWQQADFEEYEPSRFMATRARGEQQPSLALSPVEIRLEPFQERLLEQIQLSRELGHHRNLLAAATGTGKTVMAAVDYARLKSRLGRARLLFVAHREEILAQSRATFAHALRDGNFGELWVGGDRPTAFEHVFASIQSLNASGVEAIEPRHFDVVIVDEFHHAAAASYERLLMHLEPIELLGLTATPERSDGLPILHWFDNRIAAELRLWDAIEQHRLVPFSYFGVADNLDLREIPWRRGTGYDVAGLTDAITSTDAWARMVVQHFRERLGGGATRALGFCVSVDHARYMARVFSECGVPAVAVSADTRDHERVRALTDLEAGRLSVVFSVDLFNEGVDVPAVNSLMMLRPTESPLLFLQQLGRGLRKAPGKALCTVLDFVGQHRKEFRYDRRLRALLGGSRSDVEKHVKEGFPFLPSGCSMQLDRVATERVLSSIRYAVPSRWNEKVNELRSLATARPDITLSEFLEHTGLDLDDIYAGHHCWSDLRESAGLSVTITGAGETTIRRAVGRLLHVDDAQRLTTWAGWLRRDSPPEANALSHRERILLHMLLVQVIDQPGPAMTLAAGAALLWTHAEVRRELVELFDILVQRVEHLPIPLSEPPDLPLTIHSRYTRVEMLAAAAAARGTDRVRVRPWREGLFHDQELRADFLAFTLDKTSGQFSPTTRYRDYAISRELIHWESQSTTRADSPTGRRFQRHASTGDHILLFARLNTDERAFVLLGPATYVSHVGETPMAITWRLEQLLPGDLFQKFAAAVA